VAYVKLLLLPFTYTVGNPDFDIGFIFHAIMRIIKHNNMFQLSEHWNITSRSFESIRLHLCPLNKFLYNIRRSQRNFIALKLTC
jgi:hypothetical protein